MGVLSATQAGRFDEFTLPEDPKKAKELEGKPVYDATKISFWQNKKLRQAVGIIAVAALTVLSVVLTARYLGPHMMRSRDGAEALIWIYILEVLLGVLGIVTILNHKGYQDPESRKGYRVELETDKITVVNFINKHGWKEMRIWGFFLAEDQEPLCTKKLLAEKILKTFSSRLTTYLVNSYRQEREVVIHNQYYTSRHPYSYYAMSAPHLWEALDHGVFTAEQKEKVKKEFENHFDGFSVMELFANWNAMKKAGFHEVPGKQKICQWIESNHVRFEQLQRLYVERANFFLKKISGIQMPEHKEYTAPSKELSDSLPPFEARWYHGFQKYIEGLNELNRWYLLEVQVLQRDFNKHAK